MGKLDDIDQHMGRHQSFCAENPSYAFDAAIGLPEVVFTSEGHKYLHLPGVIMTESDTGEVRYLLGDGLGSVRHVVDEAGVVVAYREYDSYGNPVAGDESGYAFTSEWWESEVGLLHLRARWYDPGVGVFLSKDPWSGNIRRPQSMNGWNYVQGNVTNFTDPSGLCPGHPMCDDPWWPIRQVWEYAEETIDWAKGHPAQAWGLPKDSLKTLMLEDWLFEKKGAERGFDASHAITQLVMQHQGVNQARYKFLYEMKCNPTTHWFTVEGPPYIHYYQITVDDDNQENDWWDYFMTSSNQSFVDTIRGEGQSTTITRKDISLGGAYNFAKSNVVLVYEIAFATEDTADTIVGTLGSYRVTVEKSNQQMAFEVYNLTGRESFTRDYFYPPLSLMANQDRQQTEPLLIFDEGWGGNMEQYIRWTEDIPEGICNCSGGNR